MPPRGWPFPPRSGGKRRSGGGYFGGWVFRLSNEYKGLGAKFGGEGVRHNTVRLRP
jgi:hypothetical protein